MEIVPKDIVLARILQIQVLLYLLDVEGVQPDVIDYMIDRYVVVIFIQDLLDIDPEALFDHSLQDIAHLLLAPALAIAQHVVQAAVGIIEIIPEQIEMMIAVLYIKLDPADRLDAVFFACLTEFVSTTGSIMIG